MPRSPRTIRLQRLEGQVGDVAYQLTKVHFSGFRSHEGWRPAINAYRCEHCIRICVDLAGVDHADIRLDLAPRQLTIRGNRTLPEPDENEHHAMQVLAMEIDHGPFERTITLPAGVDHTRVKAEQRDGLLWVTLPLQHH